MNRLQTFEQFLTTQSIQVPIIGFIINLALGAILSFILARVYVKNGNSLSNRKIFTKNLMLLAMTTLLIITIVKSSLALSLGLVGALSIVRFRSAIKEPEELAYLFLNIAIGLGLGADQRAITVVAFVIIVGVIILKNLKSITEDSQNLHITVSSHNPQKIALEQIVSILKKHSAAVDLKRFDETQELIEATFLIEFDSFEKLNQSKEELQKANERVRVTFLDNKGIL